MSAKPKRKIGLPPGAVIFTGDQKVEQVITHFLQYNSDTLIEKELNTKSGVELQPSAENLVDWYDIRGLHDTEYIQELGKMFDIHPLIQEDIADIHNRPKYEEYGNGIFVVLKALNFNQKTASIEMEQIGIYFTAGFVISFQETASDLFSLVRKRINSGRGRIREKGADYLAYALIDAIVDQYYVVVEMIESHIEGIEEDLLESSDHTIKERIHLQKRELLAMRKSLAPLREAISKFSKSDSNIIAESTSLFIMDLYDHTIQILDMVDSYRDALNGLQDLHLSEITFKMNQVMQVLTVITTIFVPLSFLTGLYGMNFEWMPELHYRHGYPILLGVMFLILSGSLFYFKKKKWF